MHGPDFVDLKQTFGLFPIRLFRAAGALQSAFHGGDCEGHTHQQQDTAPAPIDFGRPQRRVFHSEIPVLKFQCRSVVTF
jgi:hypothetical protein